MPQCDTTKEFPLCGFTQKTIRFCWMMKSLGHTVFLYGGPNNEAECDEFIPVVDKRDQIEVCEFKHYIEPSWSPEHRVWVKFNHGMAQEVRKRMEPGDFICTLGGYCFLQLFAEVPELTPVEYGIGYFGFRVKHKVWENGQWRWFMKQSSKHAIVDMNDPVIPAFFDENDFSVSKPSGDLLYVGRITESKGVEDACKAARIAGKRLLVAGVGNKKLVTDGAVYLGPVSMAERNRLMSEASALLCPTRAFEANGNVAIEAQLCGTPVISTNHGGWVETVLNGQTGWRISDVPEMVQAITKVGLLDDRQAIRKSAVERFSMRNIRHRYDTYFRSILSLC